MQETSSPVGQESNKSKSKLFLFFLIFVLALIAFGYYFLNSDKKTSNTNQIGNNTTLVENESKQISLAEISKHNIKTDCWTTINGEVFDLTKFVGMHKGGDKILNACGVDATDYFTGRHPTIGRVHSQMAVKLLQGMKIGDLQK